MISVIIPILNESETVASLVQVVKTNPKVDEILVVDDGSLDKSPDLARNAGARVITSTFLGKGASLRDGLHTTRNKIVIYLDPQQKNVTASMIDELVKPLLDGQADLVKARWGGITDPVNQLTARPLLRTFFPELNHLEYPLSKTWAARRSVLLKLAFEMDYGVELGLLLDASLAGAKIVEVDLGLSWCQPDLPESFPLMASQITRTILSRAAQHNRLKPSYISKMEERDRHTSKDLDNLFLQSEGPKKIALLDMDGVIVCGQFILELAYHTDRGSQLAELLDDPDLEGDVLLEKVATLFAGIPLETFQRIAHDMTLIPGAREAVAALRKMGYVVGVVSQSFRIAAEIIRCRVLADFSIAHMMKFQRGKATGRLTYAPAMAFAEGCQLHPHCKSNILQYLQQRMQVPPERILAIGNSEEDICMLKAAGESIAFRPNRQSVRNAAQHTVEGALTDILQYLEPAWINSAAE